MRLTNNNVVCDFLINPRPYMDLNPKVICSLIKKRINVNLIAF